MSPHFSLRTTAIGLLAAAAAAASCGGPSSSDNSPGAAGSTSAGASGRGGSSAAMLDCRQKDGALGDPDCATAPGSRTLKLDCSTAAERDQALAAGCVLEDPTDADSTDVCCPSTVSGTPEQPGTGGSGGSGGTAPTGQAGSEGADGLHTITCDQQRSKDPFSSAVGAVTCSCTGDEDLGPEDYEGEICGQGDDELFCCADAGYPASGSCDCRLTRPWECYQLGDGGPGGNVTKCSCAFNVNDAVGLVQVPTCDLTTPYTQVCCRDDALPVTCECRYTDSCGSGETQVSDCSTPEAAGFLGPPTTCPEGQAPITSCSEGLTEEMPAPGGSSCDPASCSGSDCAYSGGYSFCCFWSCGASGCEQTCSD